MNIQVSLPYKVPCVYNCKFCCNTTHTQFKGDTLGPIPFADKLIRELNTHPYDSIVLTGENEPLQSLDYVVAILIALPEGMQVELTMRGHKIDILMENYPKLMKKIRLINFSVVNDGQYNNIAQYMKQSHQAMKLKKLGIRTRFTFLLTKFLSPHQVREAVNHNFADEFTLKQLQGDTNWIKKNSSERALRQLLEDNYSLEQINERFAKFNLLGTPVWWDRDCQNGDDNYVIFRPDGKLYKLWTSKVPMDVHSND